MATDDGAVVGNASAAPQGADPNASAGPDPNATPASAPQEGAAPDSIEQQLRTTQGTVDAMRAQLLAQQQMLGQMMQQRSVPQAQAEENPYDPATQSTQWWKFEMQKDRKATVQEAQAAMMQVIAHAASQQSEQSWQAKHPEIGADMVRAWARVNMDGYEPRGEGALDKVLMLMTMPNQMQAAQAQAVNQFYSQARQPANTATPLRGGPAPPGPAKTSFEAMAKAWAENPAIEKTWTPEQRQAFENGLELRNQLIRQGRL